MSNNIDDQFDVVDDAMQHCWQIGCASCRTTTVVAFTDIYMNPLMGRGPGFPETNSITPKCCPVCGATDPGNVTKLQLPTGV